MAFLHANNAGDSYYTPSWAYESLPINWKNYKEGLEPSMGDGRILVFLEEQGLRMDGRDLDWQGETNQDEDFLKWDGFVDLIMTNPPFSKALEFMTHGIERSKTMLLLLPLNYLGSQKRHKFYSANPPDALFVLSKRPSFRADGKTAAKDYAWYLWQNEEKHISPGTYFVMP